MPIHLTTTLSQALEEIEFTGEQQEFSIHEEEQPRTDEVLNIYGAAKWAIIDLLNQHYTNIISTTIISTNTINKHSTPNFDLYNWLLENKEDEVAYFLNEAGSNCLSHSQYKAPSKFRLWLGKKGFIIGIEQKGKGFSVEQALASAGGFFTFFEQSKSTVFFDNPREARMVLMVGKG